MTSQAIVHLPSAAGHFLVYAQCFVEAVHRRYAVVKILVPDTEPPEAFVSLTQSGATVMTYRAAWPKLAKAPALYSQLSGWLGVRRACQSLGAPSTHLILTYLDMFATAFFLLGPPAGIARTFALTMRADIGQHASLQSGKPRWNRRLKHWMWKRLLRRPFNGVLASNDPCLIREAHNAQTFLLEDFSFCHDLPPVGRVDSELRLIAMGYLDGRKNLDLLLQAVLHSRSELGVLVHLTLAGELIANQMSAAGQLALADLKREQAVTIIDGFVSEEDYRKHLADAHAVWVVYKNHDYASGIVLDALASNRALVAQSSGVIGHYASRSGSSVVVDGAADFTQVAQALVRLSQMLEGAATQG